MSSKNIFSRILTDLALLDAVFGVDSEFEMEILKKWDSGREKSDLL